MQSMKYSHRNSLIHKNRTYRITDFALLWKDDDLDEVSLPFEDIVSVEGKFSPTRVQGNRYVLRLITRHMGKIDITNTTYKGIGNFEELNNEYVAFVSALNKQISESNPSAKFIKGSSWVGYIFAIFMGFILLAVIVAALVFFLTAGIIWIAAIKLGILVFFFPRLFRYIKHNKPGVYDPLNIPSDVLPSIQ